MKDFLVRVHVQIAVTAASEEDAMQEAKTILRGTCMLGVHPLNDATIEAVERIDIDTTDDTLDMEMM